MLFQKRFHEGIRRGTITQTFRAWKSPRVVVGHRYRFAPAETVEVITCEEVPLSRITVGQARKAGFDDREELLQLLARAGRGRAIFRVRFRHVDEIDPRILKQKNTGTAALDETIARLEAMDRRSRHGPWTRQTLEWIAAHPRTVSNTLARQLNRERLKVKADVRKLKALGLTISREIGYELSPRGKALLKRWMPES